MSMKRKRKNLTGAFAFFTAAAVLVTSVFPTAVSAETSSPTPDPHGAYYAQQAQTDLLEGWPAGPSIEGEAAVMVDLSTGGILYSKNADTVLYPASITKIMTCLLAVENLDMNMQFEMSQSAAFGIESGSSSIYADTGEIFTVEQAVMALMLESANEMALMLGELVSGSEKKFIELMNEKAAGLGCTRTHFNNPNGLPDENHYTTAGDMAKILFACWKNPLFRKFVTTNYYNIPPTNKQAETRYMSNHDKMMEGKDYAYDGVLGGKTGYTVAAGNTLVTYARRGNLSLGVVVLHSVGGAYDDTARLLDYGFGNFRRMNMNSEIESLHFLSPVKGSYMYLAGDDLMAWPVRDDDHINVTVPDGITAEMLDVIRVPHKGEGGSLPYNEYVFYYKGNRVGIGYEHLDFG